MTVVLLVIVLLVVILAVWQTIQLQTLRSKVDAVPHDGNVIAMLGSVDARITSSEKSLVEINKRVELIEERLPFALSYVGVVSYSEKSGFWISTSSDDGTLCRHNSSRVRTRSGIAASARAACQNGVLRFEIA